MAARRVAPPQLAFVIGGSEGIGLAIAERLAGGGADVAIMSRSAAKLDAAIARIEARRRTRAQRTTSFRIDVVDGDGTAAALDAAITTLGVPDLVVTTAGYARPGWLVDLPSEHVRGMFEVNLLGTVNVCRAVTPHLIAAGRGTIVTSSSMAGLAGVYGYTVYSATKFGVLGFSEALRRELRPYGVDVKVLCPPNTRTPGLEEENRHKPPEVLAAEETVQTLSPDQVANELMRALRRPRRFLVIPGRSAKSAAWAIRHAPALVDRALRRPPPRG